MLLQPELLRMSNPLISNRPPHPADFELFFRISVDAMLITDITGNILDFNHAYEKITGYTRDELFAKNGGWDLILEEDLPALRQAVEEIKSGKSEMTNYQIRVRNKNGELRTVSYDAKADLINNQIYAIGRDITKIKEQEKSIKNSEKALVESEEKFRAVYESSPMGILISIKPGIIVDANPAFAEMVGYSEEDLKGKNVLDITHPSDVDHSRKLLDRIYANEINYYIIEKKYVRNDGISFWGKAVVSVMSHIDDEVITVSIVENIEKKKITEQALEQKNNELTQINQELEHFAYVASHDLQEPLRTITSFIQILERRYTSQLDEDAQQFMGFVVDGAKRMQSLIHDLLEYSRINRFNTGYEKVDLNEIFNIVSRVLKEKIESNDALVIAENLPMVYGNRIQLTQVFQNLIDNAIKFKAKKRKPEIVISLNDLKDKWELVFRDNGIGISQEYFQRIFVIFQRLHTLEEYTGTGIGLAICKKIIERHGGEIWVESKTGKGTAFHLTISKQLMKTMAQY